MLAAANVFDMRFGRLTCLCSLRVWTQGWGCWCMFSSRRGCPRLHCQKQRVGFTFLNILACDRSLSFQPTSWKRGGISLWF